MKNLVNTGRARISTSDHSSLLASTQSDRARVIYSAPFRRLQQKAQVFSLESNAAVRSRLTHSIEVSHIGRCIASQIAENIASNIVVQERTESHNFWINNTLSISNIIETSCLLHDIGNPPFGHFGESAIAQWFNSENATNALKLAIGDTRFDEDSTLVKKALNDFICFDGNPQGFRIITKLQGDDGLTGLNLTFSQLSAFLKYTSCPNTLDSNKPFSKKIGYFSTEENIINECWDSLGMERHTRHPLGFLMEASDDISYCISDIEDGIEKNIITAQGFFSFVHNELMTLKTTNNDQIIDDLLAIIKPCSTTSQFPVGKFISFKAKLSNYLTKFVADTFTDNFSNYISLTATEEILNKKTTGYNILKILRVFTAKNIFASSETEAMELSGFAIISGILEEHEKLLQLTYAQFKSLIDNDMDTIKKEKLQIHKRLFNRLPERHVKSYTVAVNDSACDDFQEWKLRAHLVVDFVSGMTDHFSMETYQLLRGIKIA